VESKWKNYHITTFLDSLSPKTLSLEEAMDLSRDRNEMNRQKQNINFRLNRKAFSSDSHIKYEPNIYFEVMLLKYSDEGKFPPEF
jgi:hypothetical protein